ncbi:MAG: trypsin-like serine protease [Richelia sp. RM2_1_2]|nr:trypsin-like serine protease [Richelia sp. SM1_7_0]NJN10454.1 trypsin-like serine protease [Richelia sp. RM1_1_1]NJO62781.1 trypsin-like serine protease [Richelia sp. RM2_1_2]
MIHITNKTNKKLFPALATSLLALSFLPACSFEKATSANDKVTTKVTAVQTKLDSTTQSQNNPTQSNSALAASQNTLFAADLAKPAVVKVISGCITEVSFRDKVYESASNGQGSGFFASSDGYVVTNAHVVEEHKNPQICVDRLRQDLIYQIAEDLGVSPYEILNNSEEMQEIEQSFQDARIQLVNEVELPNGNTLNFDVKAYGAPIGEGKDVAVIKVQIRNAPVLKLADSELVKTQDQIVALGYPYLELGGLFDKTSEGEVTISKGEISSTNKQLPDGSTALQFNAAVTNGNSGGPVLNEQGEVVGITTFGPGNIDGVAFAVTSNTIMEFVRQAGTTNEQGIVDQLYKEALQAYNQGEYSQAIEKFETVQRLFPQHSEIDEYVQAAEEKMIAAK